MLKLILNYKNIFYFFMLSMMFEVPEANPAESNSEKTRSNQICFIFLHGVNDCVKTWSKFFNLLNIQNTRLIIPKTIPRFLTRGRPCFLDELEEDDGKIAESVKYVHSLVDNEINLGTPSTNIVIGGFSQGGTLALTAALRYPKKLGGIITICSWWSRYVQQFDISKSANYNITNIICYKDNADDSGSVEDNNYYDYYNISCKVLSNMNYEMIPYHQCKPTGIPESINRSFYMRYLARISHRECKRLFKYLMSSLLFHNFFNNIYYRIQT